MEHGRALEAHVESFAPRLCFFKGVFFVVWYLTASCHLRSEYWVALARWPSMERLSYPYPPTSRNCYLRQIIYGLLIIVSYISPNAIHQLLGLHREGIDPSKIEKIQAASRNPLLTGKIPFAISILEDRENSTRKPRTQRKWYRYSRTARP